MGLRSSITTSATSYSTERAKPHSEDDVISSRKNRGVFTPQHTFSDKPLHDFSTSRLQLGGAEYVFITNTSLVQQSVQFCCCRRLDWFRNSISPVGRLKRSQSSTKQPSNHTNMTTTPGFAPQMSSTHSLTRPYSAQASPCANRRGAIPHSSRLLLLCSMCCLSVRFSS